MATNDPTPKPKLPRIAFFAALALFAVANVIVFCFRGIYQPPIAKAVLESSPEAAVHKKEWTWWLARKWLEQSTSPDVVVFGSSQMGSAICAADAQHDFKVVDSLLHRRISTMEDALKTRLGKSMRVFSLAQPGAMCSDAYMASKALFRKDLQPKVVIIGIAPRDFIDNTMPYVAATEPFRFYSRYVSAGKLTWCAYNDLMSWLQCGVDSLPFKRLGNYLQDLAAQAPSEQFEDGRPSLTAIGAVLGAGAAEPGKWLVPANIPADLWMDNTKEYKNRFKNPNTPVYEAEKNFFNAFLANMQARGIPVIVVGMPSLPMNRQLLPARFWNNFRSSVGTMCTLHNAQFLDLTDSPLFVKSDYLDTVHLNAKGGIKLFNILADYAVADDLVKAQLTTDPPAIQTAAREVTRSH